MEGIMALLTGKHQTVVRTVFITGMTAHRASFARVVGVYLDCHRTMHECLIGDHALQFGKRPLGVGSIGLPLLLTGFFAALARGSISDICQTLQSDQAMGMSGHNAFG